MDYFILTCGEHTRPLHSAELGKFSLEKLLSKQQTQKFDDITIIITPSKPGERYGDIITSPVYLVSDEMKVLFAKYDKTLVFKAVRLVDEDSKKQTLYWIMGVEELHCLSEQTVLNPPRMRHLVLDQDKINKTPIFKLGGILENYLIVRLDVAESLLRRNFYGIELRKMSVAKAKEII